MKERIEIWLSKKLKKLQPGFSEKKENFYKILDELEFAVETELSDVDLHDDHIHLDLQKVYEDCFKRIVNDNSIKKLIYEQD